MSSKAIFPILSDVALATGRKAFYMISYFITAPCTSKETNSITFQKRNCFQYKWIWFMKNVFECKDVNITEHVGMYEVVD